MPLPLGTYTTRQVAALSGLSVQQVRRCARAGLITPEKDARGRLRFGFQDLVFLRTWKRLRETRLGVRRIGRAVRELKARRPEAPLSAFPIRLDGASVLVRDEAGLFDPVSGQAAFDFEAAEGRRVPAGEATRRASHAATVAPLRRRGSASDWYARACAIEEEDPRLAWRYYLQALELDPGYSDAHVNVGRLLHLAGRLDEAEAHYRSALKHRPRDPTARFNLGVVLEDQGRLQEAVEAYRAVLELDMGFADAHYNLAHLYQTTGDAEAALRHLVVYRRLVDSEP